MSIFTTIINNIKTKFYYSSLFVLILLVIAVSFCYHATLNHPLIFDDYSTLVENMSIRDLRHIWPILENPTELGLGWRPFANLTFAFSYALSGLDPWGHHLLNIVIHTLNAWILFNVIVITLNNFNFKENKPNYNIYISSLMAIFWAVHPVLTQTITYISQRTESLMALTYLLTIFCFIRACLNKSTIWYISSICACVVGTMCKEVIVTAPLVILLYDRCFISSSFKLALKKRWLYYCGIALSWIPLAIFIKTIKHQAVGFEVGISPFTYALTECKAILLYIKLCYFPYPLIFDRGPLFIRTISEALPYVCLLITLLSASIFTLIKKPKLGFLCITFFILLSPSSSFVPIAEVPVAENRIYLPSSIAIILVILFLEDYLTYFYKKIGYILILILLITLSYNRNQIYSSATRIWQDSVDKMPNNARAHNNLGLLLYNTPNHINEAEKEFQTAIFLNPKYSDAQNNLGLLLSNQPGKTQEAIKHYELAIKYNANNAEAHVNLANIIGKNPDRESEAREHIKMALTIKPYSAEFNNNYAVLLALNKDTQIEAIKYYEEAIRLKPSYAEAHNNLANILAKYPERQKEAYNHYIQALLLMPNSGELHYNFALFLKQYAKTLTGINSVEQAADEFIKALDLGIWHDPKDIAYQELNVADLLSLVKRRSEDAKVHYQKSLIAYVQNPITHLNYAISLENNANLDLNKIIYHYEKALELNPNIYDAHKALGNIYSKDYKTLDLAINHYKEAIKLTPNSVFCLNNLGLLLSSNVKTKLEAESYFKKALTIDPQNAETHNNYGALLATMGSRKDEAIKHYQEAIKFKSHFAEAHNNLANLLASYPTKTTESIKHYNLALQDNPSSYAIHYNLALQLEKMPGKGKEALYHYTESLKYKPDFKAASDAINRLKN